MKGYRANFYTGAKSSSKAEHGAAEAALWYVHEIGGQSLEQVLGNLDGESGATPAATLGEVSEKVNVALAKTHTLGCSLYETFPTNQQDSI